jgi:hypothetical protein
LNCVDYTLLNDDNDRRILSDGEVGCGGLFYHELPGFSWSDRERTRKSQDVVTKSKHSNPRLPDYKAGTLTFKA